jgi:DNA gyrase/topoisomerase IV subunit B
MSKIIGVKPMSDEDLKKLIESNAKAIQALTEAVNQDREDRKKDREEWRQDRRRVFEWMSRLAAAQADFYNKTNNGKQITDNCL